MAEDGRREVVEPHHTAAGPHVLVVEDQAEVARTFAIALRGAGYAVTTARTGGDALQAVADDRPDLILLDAGLPDITGEEVLRRLRDLPRSADIPVIMVTGEAPLARRIAGLRGGADDYLTKPIWPEELVARVEAQLRRHQNVATQVDRALGVQLQLARQVGGIDPGQPLARVVRALGDLLRDQLGVDGLAVSPLPTRPGWAVDDAGGRIAASLRVPDDASAGASLEGLGSRWLAHVPLEAAHGSFAVLSARLPDAPDARLAALVGVAPQVSALLHRAMAHDDMGARRAELVHLLARGGIRPVFQPVVQVEGGAVVGFEGLSRFDDGADPAPRFRAAAEAGMGAEMEIAAITAIVAASRDLPADAWLGVNVSVETLLTVDLQRVLAGAARQVVIEITEHELVEDYEAVKTAVKSLDGVKLGVDDTGAGYASLRHVHQLHPQIVKLDSSLVVDVDGDLVRQALIAGMRRFTDELGALLLAEGVERAEDLDCLRTLGVPLAQGFLVGHPAPAPAWST